MKFLPKLFYILILVAANSAFAVSPGEVRFANEETDTIIITSILKETDAEHYKTMPEKILAIAGRLIDTPYAPGTIDIEPEQLTVNLSQMDCTTFVETVLAMAITLDEKRTSWHDFIYNLERLRYRNGQINGYSSRLHYISDWIIDNAHRGTLLEVTDRISDPSYQIKTLDFMTKNRDKYPQLASDEEFEKMKTAEIGYRSHRYPYVKSPYIKNIQLQDGDIVAITTKTPGLDIQHIGFIKIIDKEPHLFHASSAQGKVLIDPVPLYTYLKHNRTATGIRVIRLKD